MSKPGKAVRVPVYLQQADQWHHRPLNLEMLSHRGEQDVTRAARGYSGSQIKTRTLVDAGGKLPLVLTFIDSEEHVSRVLLIGEVAPNRLIVSEKIALESGGFQ